MKEGEIFRQLSRADVLLGQSRFAQAEELLERLFTEGIENTEILKMMSIAKMGLQKYADAEQLCKIIIEQNPNESFAFYILSNIKSHDRKFDEAKSWIKEAIRLEPANADFHAFDANVSLQTKDFQQALDFSDVSLRLDPENIAALNTRSSALVGLGRKDEAFATIEKSLATDPNNPNTHANLGWGLLHHGMSAEALIHFKTALKEDPMHEFAKAGMLEAMKAKFPVYRYFLMLMLWLSKLKGKNQWVVIIGSYIALRLISYLAENNERLWPFLIPVIVLIVLFFISTWIFSPLMNLYLLSNEFGRYTLKSGQKLSARLVGLALALSIITLFVYFFLSSNKGFLSSGIFIFLLMIPLGTMFNPILVANRKKLVYSTITICILVLVHCIVCIYTHQLTSNFTIFPFGALIAYQWYANYILIRE